MDIIAAAGRSIRPPFYFTSTRIQPRIADIAIDGHVHHGLGVAQKGEEREDLPALTCVP